MVHIQLLSINYPKNWQLELICHHSNWGQNHVCGPTNRKPDLHRWGLEIPGGLSRRWDGVWGRAVLRMESIYFSHSQWCRGLWNAARTNPRPDSPPVSTSPRAGTSPEHGGFSRPLVLSARAPKPSVRSAEFWWGSLSPRNPALLAGKQEVPFLCTGFNLLLVHKLINQFHWFHPPAYGQLWVWTWEGRVCPGSCEII